MLKIVVDGSADMPDDWEKNFDLHVLPINIHFGEKTFVQGVNLNREQFYQLVNQNRVIPSTSLPSPYQIVEFYRKIAQKGETILSIHVGSKMSGTYAAAQAAARELF